MNNLLNDAGDIINNRTLACIEQVRLIVSHHLDCLVDSGACAKEIKAVTKEVCKAIKEASGEVIFEIE